MVASYPDETSHPQSGREATRDVWPEVTQPTKSRTANQASVEGLEVRVMTTVSLLHATSRTGWHEPAPALRIAKSAPRGSVVSSIPAMVAALLSPARRRGLSASRMALMRAEGGGYTTDQYEDGHEVRRGYFYPFSGG